MAYEKTGLSPHEFFEEAIFGTNSNPICNGLNLIEDLDQYLYEEVAKNGFLSAIMTQQPNKSGCWMVEMFDVYQYLYTNKSVLPELGICGKQIHLGSGIQYWSNDKKQKFGQYTMTSTIPKYDNCYYKKLDSGSEEENRLRQKCDNLKNDSKIVDCGGCNDTNRALCVSCKGVPVSEVCLSSKKVTYSA
tara:strand:- start:171 stop:737 length:567 start_codon:yes stop_codon:yes gene_type:complete